LIDSVFSPLLEVPSPDDVPLIPATEITRGLDAVEAPASEIMARLQRDAAEVLLRKAGPFLADRNLAGIQSLTWNLGVTLQSPIYSVWALGFELGSGHMLREMKAALPKGRFATTQEAVAALLVATPTTITNTPAQAAVARRALTLAGNFSDDQLTAIKGHLQAAIVPVDGKLLSRPELLQKIEGTLSVGKTRAEMIARTELTNAYNSGRVQTALQSSLVTHLRFLAISDARTTPICRSRNGMLIPVTDRGAIGANSPSLHVRCRSVLSPVMAGLNPTHAKWASDPGRDYQARNNLAPLPKGWRTGELPAGAVVSAPISPVSDALKINQMPRAIRTQVVEALKAIDSVHTDGLLPTIPINVADLGNASAKYTYTSPKGSDPFATPLTAKRIDVAKNSKRPGLAVTHEVGHFLDSQVLHSGEKVGMASMLDPDLQEWRVAIANSKAYQRLIDMQSREFVRAWDPALDALTDRPLDKDYLGYLASPHEAFARSYAQYIAQKSGNKTLLSQLAPLQVDPLNAVYPSQWEIDDFAQIEAAFDKLFEAKKWLK
jgi:SPP1 gp7 family putative phage head morphogenesis protein